MLIANIHHFLDAQGNIDTSMSQQQRQLAGFLALIIDNVTQKPQDSIPIRCMKPDCEGSIMVEIVADGSIKYKCNHCSDTQGIISDWQASKFDNRN
ncbi:MAG: hypothetical protein ACM3ME_05925 [Chloroflexota bacterium]|nr:hypothetical protein [Lentimicrobium sp.]